MIKRAWLCDICGGDNECGNCDDSVIDSRIEAYRAALDFAERRLGHYEIGMTQFDLGRALISKARTLCPGPYSDACDEARDLLHQAERALLLAQDLLEDVGFIIFVHHRLAVLWTSMGRGYKAEGLVLEKIEALSDPSGAMARRYSSYLSTLELVYTMQAKHEKAQEVRDKRKALGR